MRTIAAGFAVLLLLQVPAPHAVTVQTADDLYRALASARGGQTILLQAGTTYVGNFVLPARSESDTAVITIRTDVARLPEGRRITPAAARSLARIQSPNAQPALATAAGTHNWTIELVEFGPNANGIGDIITLGDSSERSLAQVPSQLTLDRIYVHGDPVAGQKRGIALNSASTKIINSYISDIKTIGQDSQAIAGWNGPGGYLIQNNFLEAAGENVM